MKDKEGEGIRERKFGRKDWKNQKEKCEHDLKLRAEEARILLIFLFSSWIFSVFSPSFCFESDSNSSRFSLLVEHDVLELVLSILSQLKEVTQERASRLILEHTFEVSERTEQNEKELNRTRKNWIERGVKVRTLNPTATFGSHQRRDIQTWCWRS